MRACEISFRSPQERGWIQGTISVATGTIKKSDKELETEAKETGRRIWKDLCSEQGHVYVFGVGGGNIFTLQTPDTSEFQPS